MNTQTQFISLLKTIFQFNKNKIDLDFGVYKIFKYKESEIVDFIEKRLPSFIEEAVADIGEYDIYRDVLNFFSRYYEQGDFYPTPVFSKNKHHIFRHNGEEVIFSWANRDQYYIKSVNSFQEYKIVDINVKSRKKAFKGVTSIKFLIDEIEEEKGTTKSGRVFVLSENKKPQVSDDGKSFILYFDYKKSKTPVTLEALKKIFESEKIEIENLDFHFKKFNSLHKSDFFIHKDLDSFLTMELDYYIKTVILDLDKLEIENDLQIRKAIAIKKIGAFIIKFLASMENLQKLLWEKKKFAYDVNYIITLDKIHPPLLRKIISHEKFNKQVEEWKGLGLIEKFPKNSFIDSKTKEIKEEYKYLPLDTAIFEDKNLTYNILEYIEYLDDAIDSVLVNSDNFHGLKILSKKYGNSIKSIYIDPPYNTGTDGFAYKDHYKHSSWASMMYDRLDEAKILMKDSATIFINIDEREQYQLKHIADSVFAQNFIADFPRVTKKAGKSSTNVSKNHDTLLAYSKTSDYKLNAFLHTDSGYKHKDKFFDKRGAYKLNQTLDYSSISYSVSLDYEIEYNGTKLRPGNVSKEDMKKRQQLNPERDYCWRWSKQKFDFGLENEFVVFKKNNNGEVRIYTKTYQNATIDKNSNGEYYIKYTPKTKPLSTLDFIENRYSNDNSKKDLSKMFNQNEDNKFEYSKPVELIRQITLSTSNPDDIILDFFAGSGTTGESTIRLNRDTKLRRKQILIEANEYFGTILVPRIKKSIYSDKWKDGKAQAPNGISHVAKYFKLEQYEDALENTVFDSSDYGDIEAFKDGLEPFKEYMTDHYHKSYLSLYEHFGKSHSQSLMMKIENELLNKPFDFKLKIYEDGIIREKTMDLVETFNTLIGINVLAIKMRKYRGNRYVFVGSQDTLVIWREFDSLEEAIQTEYKNKEMEFIQKEVDLNDKTIYMNGVCQTHSRIEFDAKETLFALREKLID